MSDSDELVRKTDAFISRYRPGAAQNDFPVLTEVVAGAAPPPASAAGDPSEPELRELEQRLRQQLQDAIVPFVVNFLEEPLRARLEQHLQRALAAVAEQTRADVESLVREAIGRAVEHEIARLREPSRDGR